MKTVTLLFKEQKNTESKNLKVVSLIMLSPKFTVYGSKKSRFIKEQETSGLLSGYQAFNHLLKKLPILRNIS